MIYLPRALAHNMNIKRLTLVTAIFSCLFLGSLSAAKSNNKGFNAMDANGNGSLTLNEYESAILKKQQARWQAKGLSADAIEQATQQVKAVAKRGFDEMDWNGDGKVTFP